MARLTSALSKGGEAQSTRGRTCAAARCRADRGREADRSAAARPSRAGRRGRCRALRRGTRWWPRGCSCSRAGKRSSSMCGRSGSSTGGSAGAPRGFPRPLRRRERARADRVQPEPLAVVDLVDRTIALSGIERRSTKKASGSLSRICSVTRRSRSGRKSTALCRRSRPRPFDGAEDPLAGRVRIGRDEPQDRVATPRGIDGRPLWKRASRRR